MFDPSSNISGLYEVIWLDKSNNFRRRRFYCDSNNKKHLYKAGKKKAEESRHGSKYVVVVRDATPKW